MPPSSIEQVLAKKKPKPDTVGGFDKMTASIFYSRTLYVQYKKGLQALGSSSCVGTCERLCLGKAHGTRVIYECVCVVCWCVQQSVGCSGGWLTLDPPLDVLIWTLVMDFVECKFL